MNTQQLTQLYNTLCLIKTEGQNTVFMANCIIMLKGILDGQAQETQGDANDQ